MSEQEIIETNKIIAEFMDAIYYPKVKYYYLSFKKWSDVYTFPGNRSIGITPKGLKFHSSWDWLMPVINKIKRMKHDPKEMFMGTTFERKIMFEQVTELPIYTSIETVYDKIIKFIEWYNLQKNK